MGGCVTFQTVNGLACSYGGAHGYELQEGELLYDPEDLRRADEHQATVMERNERISHRYDRSAY